jgi:hypothetical protein
MQQETHLRHKRKRKLPAIILIQRYWRYFSVNKLLSSITWNANCIPMNDSLMDSEKNAVRFIRKVQFFIAKQRFKEYHQSGDIKELLEKYRNDQSIILHKIKEMQTDFNGLIGKVGSNSKRLNESKSSFLVNMTRIERKIENIEEKFDSHMRFLKNVLFLQSSNNTKQIEIRRRNSFS